MPKSVLRDLTITRIFLHDRAFSVTQHLTSFSTLYLRYRTWLFILVSVPNFVHNYFCLKASEDIFPYKKTLQAEAKARTPWNFMKMFSVLLLPFYAIIILMTSEETDIKHCLRLPSTSGCYIYSLYSLFRSLVTFCSKIFISQLVFYFHQYDLLILHLSRSRGTKDFAAV